MKNSIRIIMSVLCLLPTLALAQDNMPMDHKMPMAADMKGGMNHNHSPQALPKNALTPKLSISLIKDDMSGVNLHLDTAQFQLESPAHAGKQPKNIVEGHGHLYVNGTKIQRIYGHDVHIPGKLIKEGMNQISVTLNSHGHNAWQKEGQDIISTIFINTQKQKFITHMFSSFPVVAGK